MVCSVQKLVGKNSIVRKANSMPRKAGAGWKSSGWRVEDDMKVEWNQWAWKWILTVRS